MAPAVRQGPIVALVADDVSVTRAIAVVVIGNGAGGGRAENAERDPLAATPIAVTAVVAIIVEGLMAVEVVAAVEAACLRGRNAAGDCHHGGKRRCCDLPAHAVLLVSMERPLVVSKGHPAESGSTIAVLSLGGSRGMWPMSAFPCHSPTNGSS